MHQKSRNGKSSELIVAGELMRHGLDVYMPCVDDQAIDMIIRVPLADNVKHYDIQVKSVAGYNTPLGLKNIAKKDSTYILIIHYRHADKPDECFYLLREQVLMFHSKDYKRGDLRLNKSDREKYMVQSLADLAEKFKSDNLYSESLPRDGADAQ